MNAKIYNGNIQPNHKEYKIWVNNEGIIKTWNGTKWVGQIGTSDDNEGGSADEVGLGQFLIRNEDGGGGSQPFRFEQGMTWREWTTTKYNIEGWYIDTHYPSDGGEPYDVIVTREGGTTFTHWYFAVSTYVYDDEQSKSIYIPVSADSKIVNGEQYVNASFGDI